MKILFVNGSDIEGGASRAATSLMQGVHDCGIEARMYVQRIFGDNPLVSGPRTTIGKAMGFVRPTLEQFLLGISPGKVNGPFAAAFLPDRLHGHVSDMAPDIVHLHWMARMMRLETLRSFTLPIIWTLHDSWAFTGGCYLPGDCTRYRETCGACPVLRSSRENDLSRQIWQRKAKAWQEIDLTLVAPSRWMADCAKASSLFHSKRIEIIPNGLDVNCFKPTDRRTAREFLSLPQDKKLVLFGAKNFTKDWNKGFHLLVQALNELAGGRGYDAVELITFGSPGPEPPPELNLKARHLGWFNDDASLARLYSAADVFVLPSIQESLGYTVMEALACGTPSVAFNQGGVTDLIDHQHNGYLAQPYDPSDLARGIAWIMEDENRWRELSNHARHKVERGFSVEEIAERHVALYRELMNHE